MGIYDVETMIPGVFIDDVVFCVEPISGQSFVISPQQSLFFKKKIITGFS